MEVTEKVVEKLKNLAKNHVRTTLKSWPGYAFYTRGAYNAVSQSRLCPFGSTAGTIVAEAVQEMKDAGEIKFTETTVVYPKNHPLTDGRLAAE